MSQQGPGGYGGGGPFGPPGGGGYGGPPPGGGVPPGGYPPPPPGGYGPSGGQPPGGGYGGPPGYGGPGYPPGGAPPGYGPAQYGAPPPAGPPPSKTKPLIWLGVGCALLLLLGGIGGVVAFLAMRQKTNDVEKQIELAASGVALGASAIVAPSAPATGVCAKTVACCQVIASKSGSNADLAVRACAAYGSLSDAVCLQQYPTLKRTAAAMGGSCE